MKWFIKVSWNNLKRDFHLLDIIIIKCSSLEKLWWLSFHINLLCLITNHFNYVNPMLMMQLGWEAMLVTTGQSRPTYATWVLWPMAPRGKLTYQFSRTIPTKLELQNNLSVILITTSAEEFETSVTSYGGFLDFFSCQNHIPFFRIKSNDRK